MKHTYSIKDYMEVIGAHNFEQFIETQASLFKKRFNIDILGNITLELSFNNEIEMAEFYQEIKFNKTYRELYTVESHPYLPLHLNVSGKNNLFDYLGSHEPNLLTLSRDLGIQFKVLYDQNYSETIFEGDVVGGELLARQCVINVNEYLPELSLGLLQQIGNTIEEFDLLLTRIVEVPTQIIL